MLNFLESKCVVTVIIWRQGDGNIKRARETTIYSEKNVATAQRSSILKDWFPRESVTMEGALGAEILKQQWWHQ